MIITDYRKIDYIVRQLNKLSNSYAKFKIVKVGKSKWTNINTKKEQTVSKIYFLGKPSSCRPIIINRIELVDIDTGEFDTYKFNELYTHVNIYEGCEHLSFDIKGDGGLIPKNCRMEIEGQEFCNPITLNHIYEGNEKDIANLLRVTLMSQNTDDGYGSNPSVFNDYMDKKVASGTGVVMLPDRYSPLELILGSPSHELRNLSPMEFNKRLRTLVSIEDDMVYAKNRWDSYYERVKKIDYEKNIKDYSKYYPVFTADYIKSMNIEIPRDYYNLGVYGLGSAGTAILDQLSRSNWLETIYICDYDIVEDKNLINQWYTSDQVNNTKTSASLTILKKRQRSLLEGISTEFYIARDNCKFQETELTTKEFKYVVSGFDSLATRKEFLDNILDGKIVAEYLIDCRYLDLACSIYIVDLNNLEEIEFYKANLEADAELMAIRENEQLTEDEFHDWVVRKGYYRSGCFDLRSKYLNVPPTETGFCPPRNNGNCSCASEECKKFLYESYLKSLPNPMIKKSDASCIKYNYIDIYQYVGAIVFGAIRQIEHGNKKPFTLCEAQTDIKGMPNYMIVKE